MRRLFPASLMAIVLIAVAMIWDYRRVDAKDRRVSVAVARCGGRMNSLPFWPLGTEYRISVTHPWSEEELESLSELNTLRGSVAVAFVDCELTQHELGIARKHLSKCHLFRISNGQLAPWTSATLADNSSAIKRAASKCYCRGELSTRFWCRNRFSRPQLFSRCYPRL